jgi:hypothetical protein
MDMNTHRDFSTISPSAKALLLLKGYTHIPFAKQAATLISKPEIYAPDFTRKDAAFWVYAVHFENRYWTIDRMLEGLPVTNILEISSGFSFRGLAAVERSDIHYVDTDLPEVMGIKRQLVTELGADTTNLEMMPLNALDEEQFNHTLDLLPPGEVAIVNEGLLVYLNQTEKQQLCGIIRNVLKRRGGYWITADIYIKRKAGEENINMSSELKSFFELHRIEENKFESFEAAEEFFKKAGFIIDKKVVPDRSKLSTLPYMINCFTDEQLVKLSKSPKTQDTWRLKVAD